MSFNSYLDQGIQQFSSDSDSASGLPAYLHVANSHQEAAGGFSLFSPSTYEDALLSSGKFAVSALVRGISSIYNMVPSTVNWLGGNMEEADTYDWLSAADSDIAQYYAAHKQSVDIVGDIGASFIPGLAGIKALNIGQKAIAAAAKGKQGLGFAEAFGLLPDAAKSIGFKYGKEIAATSQSFKVMDAQVLKGIAAGYAQQTLETAAFLGAAQVTMRSSPLFDKEDASDIFWNALGGGVVGGAIMGSIATAQTLGAVKRGVAYTNRLLNPATLSTVTEPTATAIDRIVINLHSLHNPPVAPLESEAKILQAFENTLAERDAGLWLKIREDVHALTKDPELGNQFTDALRGLEFDQAVGNIQWLQNVGRLGKEDKKTALELLTSKILRTGEGESPNLAVNYLKLHGEDAGNLLRERPPVVALADTLRSAEEVEKQVRSYGFKIGDDWSPSAARDHFETEARQIFASKIKTLDYDTVIGANDLPLLERAYELGLQQVTLTGNKTLDSSQALLEHIQKVKGEQATLLRDLHPDPTKAFSTEEIAKRVNVKRAFLEGDTNSFNQVEDLFAFQSNKPEHWKKPSYAKLAYDVKPMNELDGHVMDAITHAKANQVELRAAADRAFQAENAEINSLIPKKFGDKVIALATRYDSSMSLITGQNANYGTLGAMAQQVGAVFNKWKGQIFKKVEDTFTPVNYRVLNSQAAKDDIVKAYNLVLGSPEKYIYDAEGQRLVNRKIFEWEQAGGEGNAPTLLDKNSPTELKLNSVEAQEWIQTAITHNDAHLESKGNRLALQLGASPDKGMKGNVYFAPPDPKNFPHFAFVVDTNVTGTGHVRMIHAASANELERLVARVDTSKGLKAITKNSNEEFFQAKQQYEYNLGINENYIDSAMARNGVSAPYFATTDATKIVEEFMDWRKRIDVANAREWIKLKYAPEVEQINQLAKSYDEIALSVKANTGKYAANEVNNPYANIVKTMLDVSTKEEYPIWTPLNKLAENSVSKVFSRLQESFAKDTVDWQGAARMLEDAGIHANFTDAATMVLANHKAPKPVLEEFIRKANSALSFLMLRSDPLNAINNGFGHAVLYGAETRDLTQNIMKGNAEAAGALAELSKVKIPGKDLGEILSPTKLATDAMVAYTKLLGKDPAMKELESFFAKHNWLPTQLEQERSIVEALTLTGAEEASAIQKRLQQVEKAAQTLAKPVTSLNQGVETFNRFRSAYTAKKISDIGVQHGLITADEQLSYINTFVNRVEGNYIASQRPMLFTGPVGQAIGLFQTYQFNLMQQLFRYVGEGGNKSAGVLLGLQGTVYGMNGLPAFNAINQHLVGNWSGNSQHKDIFSQTYDTVGKEAGDWLMYGVASNAFLHPSLKVNLYSRGDINPRQVTVVPTNFADVPIVGAVTKLFTSLKETSAKIGAGADVYSTLLQGVEHAGISRPLAGLAQTMEAFGNPNLQAFSTTNKGSVIGANDLVSLTTFARLAGGRPLDEAIANDAVYRIQAYGSAKAKEIATLGEAVKTKVQTGTLDSESLNGFMQEYVARGGKQQEFSRFMIRLQLGANKSTVNSIAENLKNPGSQAMQQIMGGYRLQDLVQQ